MSELTLYARNFLHQTLAVAYTAGDGTIAVPDGAAWGSPSPTLAIILTAFKASDLNTPLFNARITGRSGNILTISAITWGTDQDLDPGDVVVNTTAAEYIDGVETALASKSSTGHIHDDRYYTEAEVDAALAAKSDVGHDHDDRYYTESEVDVALIGKSNVGHVHDERYYTEAESNTLLAGKSNTGHTHAIADVTTLQSSLDGKSGVGHLHDDRYYTEGETDAALAGKANASHTHVATDIASGTIATARLGSGTANSTTFLRGDSTWAMPAGGGWITSSKSAHFSVQTTENQHIYQVTAGSSGVVCTLPSAASAGDGFEIRVCKVDSSKGNVTFAGTGAPSKVLYFKHDTIGMRSDGSNWYIVAWDSLVREENIWGDGSDGDVTISGSVSLTRNMHYNTLTINSGAVITPTGFWLFVKGAIDLTNAPAGWLSTTNSVGGNASGTNQSTGGTTSQGFTKVLGGQINIPVNGANGGTGVGGQPSSVTGNNITGTLAATATAAQGGAGGSGSGGAGGAARSSTAATTLYRVPCVIADNFLSTASSFLPIHMGSCSGQSGSSGGGDGTNNGGGGGGSGRGATTAGVRARKTVRGASTAANGVIANGSNGGTGGTPTTGNCGGGGGGAGASGGGIQWITGELVGSVATNHLQAKGGAGGNGGAGVGTGTNGTGGYAGCGGCIVLAELCSNTWSVSIGPDVVANSGQTGGVATEFQVSL